MVDDRPLPRGLMVDAGDTDGGTIGRATVPSAVPRAGLRRATTTRVLGAAVALRVAPRRRGRCRQ
jgi:hypothetical protein